MKDIFMCILMNLRIYGKIKFAMFDDGFAKITLVDENNEYDISVIKKAKSEEKEDA